MALMMMLTWFVRWCVQGRRFWWRTRIPKRFLYMVSVAGR